MAINEACQLWIEQRVTEELAGGKSYRQIGREIAQEIEKVFETKVGSDAIRMRASRIDKQGGTNVHTPSTAGNYSETGEKPSLRNETGQFQDGTKPGPGRRPKYKYTETHEVNFNSRYALMSIAQAERISNNFSDWRESLEAIIAWVKERIEGYAEQDNRDEGLQ